MTGADRFQLFLDSTGRKKTGTGNVITTELCLEGFVDKEIISENILSNKAIQFLSSLKAVRNFYSPKLFWKSGNKSEAEALITFHDLEYKNIPPRQILNRDCPPSKQAAIHVDVFYTTNTHIFISVNHSLLDFSGMELLLKSLLGVDENLFLQKQDSTKKSFLKSFIQTIQATFFVAAKSGWNIHKLNKKKGASIPAFQSIYVTEEEWNKSKNKSKSLPLFLSISIMALANQKGLSGNTPLPLFIPVPLNRRTEEFKNVLLSNRLSFLFFRINPNEMLETQSLEKNILSQMINQAKENIPEKFGSLMNVFSFLPAFIYKAFLNLPSRGHSSTFAFSSLPVSTLEREDFWGFKILDFTHYPPFLSPPGLNLVFMEKAGGIKIISSFDERRISRDDVNLLLNDIRSNLIAS